MLSKTRILTVLLLCTGLLSCGPSDGAYVDHYPSGAIKEEGFYKEGQKSGRWRFYWKDGKTKVEGSYLKGEPHGTWTFNNKRGSVIATGTYRNGQMWDGQFVRYVLGTQKVIVVKEGQQAN
ncbi:MAG: hypothetical protein HOE48_15855 [Candidatus Latescibacteria bacterium]|jgi:antitoxin component YwqK of YwqJK toxin-antitoxin module|nr:hypothetical protein [Candidatus Latescibacterota bacterium]MBT4139395.1 hypothetical protein [Candidatus Latescibacterota bacterium]